MLVNIIKFRVMKRLIIIIILFSSIDCFSQEYGDYNITFDDSSLFFRITIDTLSYHNNIWQIGPPQKTFFNSAYSLPNVIVTDTVNPFPSNDTSVFIITHLAVDGFIWPHTVIVSGYYKSDCDSLNDFGLIEFSPDKGETWINIVNDSVYNQYYQWYTEKPALTGKVLEWTYFYVNIAELGYFFNIEYGDTLYYKFTFISDGISNQGDGLMYDNLHFEDWWEITEEHPTNNIFSTTYPNPATNDLTIDYENSSHQPFKLSLYNIDGKLIFTTIIIEDRYLLNTNELISGIYLYQLNKLDSKELTWGKIIIEK
jgi:hypothetical protein